MRPRFRPGAGILGLVGIAGCAIGLAATSLGSDGAPDAGCEPSALGLAFRDLPAFYESTSTEIVHVRVAGRDFYVPRNYFRHPPIGCGAEEDGMLLRVLLPDLAPYSEETAEQFAAQRGWGRKMNILIRPDERIRPLDESLELYLAEQSRLSIPYQAWPMAPTMLVETFTTRDDTGTSTRLLGAYVNQSPASICSPMAP